MTNAIVEINLLRLKEEVAHYNPRIVAVTKYYTADAIIQAYKAGLRDFGEARANDAIEKIASLPDEMRKESYFHFIGHLQSNKAKKVVQCFDYIQSVDSLHIAKIISDYAIELGKIQKILLQVNISEEPQKYGFKTYELKNEIGDLIELDGIEIVGIMCMAPLDANEDTLNLIFAKARELKDELNLKYQLGMTELSMGMSDDYKIALRNGATMIRIGRLLFNK